MNAGISKVGQVGQRERKTQQRVIKLLCDEHGYSYLGDWRDRFGNSNVEETELRGWLARRGESETLIGRALFELDKAAALGGSKTLYDANRAVYSLLRYGVKVKEGAGEQFQTVWLVDWAHPEHNDFAVAEEVTLAGEATKRPDLVLYVNGIALAVLELKRSTVSVSQGIRQNLDNQKKEFIRPFFSTVQLVMAGNDTEGLRYGVIETPEKYYLTWKEAGEAPDPHGLPLDRTLGCLCSKARLLEIVHDFMVFDAGTKKTCRHNQYFGVHAAQERVRSGQGGIIWHTQGSGKSLTMVWLAKWIREHVQDARVLIVTDRKELDEQITKVFLGVNEKIHRTSSGADLLLRLDDTTPWLLCSLVHKFGRSQEAALDDFVAELAQRRGAGFAPKGRFFVFVDECHRTQSGKLHDAMKALLPGAMFIGFTGTPLLKADKQKSIEVFGPYIHIYKFDEAVRDGVVLDLRYEARDIDQELTAPAKVDQWFEAKTQGLTDVAKAQLKRKWGTMQQVLSARARLEKIVGDILLDMETRDRLKSGHGNALLVAGSIYQACKLYDLFSQTDLAGKCAIVTSYQPTLAAIKGEESGEGVTENIFKYNTYRKMLADFFGEPEEQAALRVAEFESKVKERFIEEPGQMKLLIVVDMLLTGFVAPPATYLYIDKQLRDHGLFQAICRVNRLDDESKEYGYIIDYKDLFKSLEGAVRDYTSGALDGYDEEDVAGLLEDRLGKGRERLEEAREAVKALCEPVAPPRATADYLHYFCTPDTGDAEALKENERRRVALYKAVAALIRSYANLANEMAEAGYSEAESQAIKAEVTYYESVRQEVKLGSGDYVDMKMFEPAMRHLLDMYISAEESQVLSTFNDLSLVELLVERGQGVLEQLPAGLRQDRTAMAETIENNVRKLIIDEQPVNPKYYEKMSDLLDALIQERKAQALDYEEYLRRIQALATQVQKPETGSAYPASLNSRAKQVLYDNLDRDETLAIALDSAIRYAKSADWRGHHIKEKEVLYAICDTLDGDKEKAAEIFEIVKNQREY